MNFIDFRKGGPLQKARGTNDTHEVVSVVKTTYEGGRRSNQVIQAYFALFLFSNLPMKVSAAV